MVDQWHDRRALSGGVFIDQPTCPILSNNKLKTVLIIMKSGSYAWYISNISCVNISDLGLISQCEPTHINTCNVLSNHRFPLFHLLPPPCSIWTPARVRYMSSDARGMGASRQTVKILFWMALTDSLFVLSESDTKEIKNHPKFNPYPIFIFL